MAGETPADSVVGRKVCCSYLSDVSLVEESVRPSFLVDAAGVRVDLVRPDDFVPRRFEPKPKPPDPRK